MLTRRQLLQRAGTAAAAAALAAAPGAEAAPVARQTKETPDSAAPLLDPALIYLNVASLGIQSAEVLQAVGDAAARLERDPATVGYGALIDEAEEARSKAAALLGADIVEVALTRNTTEGMTQIALGCHLQRGDHVLTSNQEHPGGMAGWRYLATHAGVKIDVLPLPERADAASMVQIFQKAITDRTRVISVSHVTYTTGTRLPMEELADLAEERGCLLVVDAAQSVGAIKVKVKALKCHALVTSGHKWLGGPKGTGVLYVSSRTRDRIAPPLLAAGPGVYTASSGMRDLCAFAGLGAAIGQLQADGRAAERYARMAALRDQLYRGLENAGFEVASPPTGHAMATPLLTALLPSGDDANAVAAYLHKRHGIVVRPVNIGSRTALRVSLHHSNDEAQVDQFVIALAKRA